MTSTMNRFCVVVHLLLLTQQALGFSVATTSVPIPATNNPDSVELVELLQKKIQSGSSQDEVERIDNLVTSLIDSKTTFDPSACIDGPLFATCYFRGKKTPLWERVGAFTKKPEKVNLKGQKYSLGDTNRVVNYSEIFGSAINLQAAGTFVEINDDNLDESNEEEKSPFLNNVMNVFRSSSKSSTNSDKIKTCPYDYPVTVTEASINVFGNKIQLPIQGTGVARVLYADPNLRIFISPNDTQVTRGGGDWESAGLITVQVRVDLIDPDFDDSVLS